jgi:LuxR family maltose regulon positive regulatory protein
MSTVARCRLVDILIQWQHFEQAAEQLLALAHAQRVLPAVTRRVQLLQAWLAFAQADVTRCRDLLAERIRPHPDPVWHRLLAAREARLWLALGERSRASRALSGPIPHLPGAWQDPILCVEARLLLALHKPENALAILAGRLPTALGEGRLGHAAENLALQALAQRCRGRHAEATAALAGALTLAEPGGYQRLFLDEGAPMLGLLAEAARPAVPTAAYAARLLAAAPSPAQPHDRAWDSPIAAGPSPALTGQERRVLALLAAGHTDREIAMALGVSVNTIRSHNKSIFGKFGVRSRTQAAARARAAGLD